MKFIVASLLSVGAGGAASHRMTTGPSRRLEETAACSAADAEDIRAILSTDDYYGSESGVACRCLSPSEAGGGGTSNVASCVVPREDECEDYDCGDGWTCANLTDATVVTVCAAVREEQHWEITPSGGWSRTKVVDSRYFYRGVSNIYSRAVVTDRTTDPASCGGYFIDGEECAGCERCLDEADPQSFVMVADCTNIVEGGAATCEGGGMLKQLLVLDPDATGAPTPSPTSSPTGAPATKAVASSCEDSAQFAVGSVILMGLGSLFSLS